MFNLRTGSGKYCRNWFTKQTTRNYRIDKVVESDHFDMYRFGTFIFFICTILCPVFMHINLTNIWKWVVVLTTLKLSTYWVKPPQVVSVTNHLLCNGGYYNGYYKKERPTSPQAQSTPLCYENHYKGNYLFLKNNGSYINLFKI